MNFRLIVFSSLFLTLFPFYRMMAQKQFTGKFCKPEEAPMMVLNGEIVNVLCDTAFVINKYRMNLYEVSKNMILKNNTQNVSKLIKAYDQTLVVVSSSYDSLVFNYRKLDEIFRSTMEMNKQTLNNTQSDLEKATNSLKVTEKMLNEAILKLNERDKNSWKKKVLYFGGGILTGVLVMLVVD